MEPFECNVAVAWATFFVQTTMIFMVCIEVKVHGLKTSTSHLRNILNFSILGYYFGQIHIFGVILFVKHTKHLTCLFIGAMNIICAMGRWKQEIPKCLSNVLIDKINAIEVKRIVFRYMLTRNLSI